MLWFDKKSYERTLAVLKKEVTLTPLFADLKSFIEREFSLTIYDITFEKYTAFNKPKKNFYNYGKRYRLTCQVQSREERESMQKKVFIENIGGHPAYKMEFDECKRAVIISKFFELGKKYDYKVQAEPNDIWLDYHYWFPIDYMTFLVSTNEKAVKKNIIGKY